MGPSAHITFGYDPLVLAESFCEGVAALMDDELGFEYLADCDYNSVAGPENGNKLGHSQVLDIDSHHVGEPIYNGCRTLPTMIDEACVYAEVDVHATARIGLKGLRSPTLAEWDV